MLCFAIAGCGGAGEQPQDPAAAEPAATTREPIVTTTPVSEPSVADTATPSSTDPPAAIASATPLPGAIELLGAATEGETTVRLPRDIAPSSVDFYRLVADQGTAHELQVDVVVPAGWKFVEGAGFTDGESSMTFVVDCNGECRQRAWSAEFGQDSWVGDFVAPDDARHSFGSGSIGDEGRSSIRAVSDDASGVSRTAIYHAQGDRFLGCDVTIAAGSSIAVETVSDLCEATAADWETVISSALPPAPITQVVSDELAQLIDAPASGATLQVVPTGDFDEHFVEIALPDSAELDTGAFSTDITLDEFQSIFSEVSISATCGGVCGARDWESELNAPSGILSETRARLNNIDNDTALENGWIVGGPSSLGYVVQVVRFDNAASQYFSCRIRADGADADLVAELTSICLSASPTWFSEAG